MNLRWYLNRLRRMSAGEVGWRLRSLVLQRLWRRRSFTAKGKRRRLAGAAYAGGGAATVQPAAGAAAVAAAHAVLAGRWPLFDRSIDLSMPEPDWFRDPVTGRRSDPALYCFDVPYRRQDLVGNVKYVWEPSRLHHVTLLAAAWHLTRHEPFAELALAHLRHWWASNPPLRGIHWLSGIELGMRLLAWVWTRRLLDAWPGIAAEFEDNPVFLDQLHAHQRWLAALYSRGSSANNHLIAEMAGQYAAAVAFPLFPESAGWAARAAAILVREAAAQTFPDGINRELAAEYHPYVLELLLLAVLEGDRAGRPLPEPLWRDLRRMADALAATVDEARHPSRQGDGDDGRALILDDPAGNRVDALLELCGGLFGAAPWWPETAPGSVFAALALPLAGPRDLPGPAARPHHFPDAGLTLLRDLAPRPDAVWLRLDHGPHGFLATTAHAHADALSFELRVGGREVLVDPGTYCYHGEPEWRRFFRSTLAHNTLEVAGGDQAVQGGPFLWLSRPESWCEAKSGLDAGEVAEIVAGHDGYRASLGAVHRRRLRFDRTARCLEIEDWLEAPAPLPVRLAFHLAPGVTGRLDGARARLDWSGGGADMELPAGLAWSAAQGALEPPLGWYSRGFGQRQPSLSLVGAGRLEPGERLRTCLQLDVTEGTA